MHDEQSRTVFVRSKVEQNSAKENQSRTESSGLLTERINIQELPPTMWAFVYF